MWLRNVSYIFMRPIGEIKFLHACNAFNANQTTPHRKTYSTPPPITKIFYSSSLPQNSSPWRWHRRARSHLLPYSTHPDVILLCSCCRCLPRIFHNSGPRRDTRHVALIAHFPHILRFLSHIRTSLWSSYRCLRCRRIGSFATCGCGPFRTSGLHFLIHHAGQVGCCGCCGIFSR